MSTFIPQGYPLWCAESDVNTVYVGRVVGWTIDPDNVHGFDLVPVVAGRVVGARADGVAAIDSESRGVHFGATRSEALAAANARTSPDSPRAVEDRAWMSIWLHGNWRWLTQNMTTDERELAADAVERHWAVMEANDPDLTHDASADGLRWWRD